LRQNDFGKTLTQEFWRAMIESFRSRALKRFWDRDDPSRLPPDRITRIEFVLDALDGATRPEQLDLPGLRFHQLAGDQKGRYSVTVSANWRITFGWSDKGALNVDLEDYH
jgi:toxin HigB-1